MASTKYVQTGVASFGGAHECQTQDQLIIVRMMTVSVMDNDIHRLTQDVP